MPLRVEALTFCNSRHVGLSFSTDPVDPYLRFTSASPRERLRGWRTKRRVEVGPLAEGSKGGGAVEKRDAPHFRARRRSNVSAREIGKTCNGRFPGSSRRPSLGRDSLQ